MPDGWFVPVVIGLGVSIVTLLWTCLLFVRGRVVRAEPVRHSYGALNAWTWVFLVPALNEATTIRDSVQRLLNLPGAQRHIVVIDDGSDDATPNVLAQLACDELTVLRRELPDARVGKAAALNHAYSRIDEVIGACDRERVIVVIVDADGRLRSDALPFAGARFADPTVGGVQSLVRIYNRGRVLTWLQDIEFSVHAHLGQVARGVWGTAGMGGNGQFNRLSALDDIVDGLGPWHDRLTEDQDVGLRLIAAGWKCQQELHAVVEQQGLSGLRRLLRQRTRWAQGNLQALGLLARVARSQVRRVPRIELVAFMLMPIWQGLVGIAIVTALVLVLAGAAPLVPGLSWWLVASYALTFAGPIFGCMAVASGRGRGGRFVGLLVAHAYALYTWLIWPALVRAVWRQGTRRGGWAKTERESLEPAQS